MSRRAYPKYKPSGVEWLGDIPEHWRLLAIKRTTSVPITDGPHETPQLLDEGIPFVSAEAIKDDKIDFTKIRGFISPEDHASFSKKYKPRRGDIYLIKSGATTGNVAFVDSDEEFNIWSPLAAIRPAPGQAITLFVFFFMKSENFFQSIELGWSYGTQQNIGMNVIENIPIALPPLDEQELIAAFLGRETRRIDSLIAKKQRQIELLQEKRAALINHAVTKGLDPNVTMKDSGIDWLGQIPEHWSMKRLKLVSTLQTGLTLGKKYDGEILVTRPYLRVANVQDGYLDLSTVTEVELPPSDVSRYELRSGDVLMTEGGDFDKLGRGHVWDGQIPGCLHQNHIFAVRPKQNELRSAFLAAMLTSSHGKNYFTSTSQQTTNLATTNSTKLLSFPIPLPPPNEQDAILDRIRRAANHQQSLVEKVSSSIERLREYRTAMISGAVTGKIDVREVSA